PPANGQCAPGPRSRRAKKALSMSSNRYLGSHDSDSTGAVAGPGRGADLALAPGADDLVARAPGHPAAGGLRAEPDRVPSSGPDLRGPGPRDPSERSRRRGAHDPVPPVPRD